MEYDFPPGFYGDVRTEEVFETAIQSTLGSFDEMKERSYSASFVRLYDGARWYYASTTEPGSVQREISRLAAMGNGNRRIESDPVVSRLETNIGEHLVFGGASDVSKVGLAEKSSLLSAISSAIDGREHVDMWRANYVDRRTVKTFVSSKGADLVFDTQRVGFRIGFQMSSGERKFRDWYDRAFDRFSPLADGALEHRDGVDGEYRRSARFLLDSVNVVPGDYPVILSPMAAGVFAHESFGHKSEADFMIGDQTMKEEWKIGKRVGAPILSIVEDGRIPGAGYVPFDDEGTAARENYLIRGGVLAGRLHSSVTAASLGEEVTGNARAKDFEFEPIVRMTTTYIKEGSDNLEELVAGVDRGVIVETLSHGSGMSTFTLAPAVAYMIRDGRRAEPVKISVITGNVFETLGDIDGLSDSVEILSFTLGGCGKMEQAPLPVGFGGPWVRVRSLTVR